MPSSFTTSVSWIYSLSSEVLYDWEGEEGTVPVNVIASKLTKIGGQPVQFQAGPRYWAESPRSGPHGWGVRFNVILLFPK